jgi:hypothetical protein
VRRRKMQAAPAVEKVVQQRPYGRALMVVEATDDGPAYRRVSAQVPPHHKISPLHPGRAIFTSIN